jgi:2-polyprenyl-3-methyl-5-hydroxy-6-metoxy-1,4-benzoquinol methylase
MRSDRFFELFIKELETHLELQHYYKFLTNKNSFLFRKAYYQKRLEYIEKQITKKDSLIWDCGCGYGTTAIFLALNGYNVYGNTVEYYYDITSKRLEYWKKYGKLENLEIEYRNLFDPPYKSNTYDYVIVQDVLHHLEPNKEALDIICDSLNKNGIIISCEENGNNIINRLKLYLRRGNRRIIDIYDEKLKKHIKLGNENIQSLRSWKTKFQNSNLEILNDHVEYIRLFPPFCFNRNNYKKLLLKEDKIWRKNKLLREYLYFGINFKAKKSK